MNIAVAVLLLFSVLILVVIFMVLLYQKTFKYRVDIDVQSGDKPNSFIRLRDKCKVTKQKGGKVIIKFQKLRFVSPSIPFKWWLTTNKSRKYEIPRDGAGGLRADWSDVRQRLDRGLHLYMSTEGELRPVHYNDEMQLDAVVSQDNRNFIIDQVKENAEIASGRWERFWSLAAGPITIIFLGIFFVLFLVYITKNAQEICNVPGHAQTVINATQGLITQGTVGA